MNFRTVVTTLALSATAVAVAGAQQGTAKPDSTKAKTTATTTAKPDSSKTSTKAASTSHHRRHSTSTKAATKDSTKAAAKDTTKHS